MTSLSEDEHEIVKRHTLGKSLDHLLEPLQDAERAYSINSSYDDTPEQGYQKAVSLLLSALINAEAALVLQSQTGGHDIASELFSLFVHVRKGKFSYDYYRPLVKLVIQPNPKASDHHVWNAALDLIRAHSRTTTPITSIEQTLQLQNTSSFANSSEYRTHIDAALKEELGDLQFDVPGVFEAYFGNIAGLDVAARAILGKIQEGESPLYDEERGWKDWPQHAMENDVLKWLVDVTGEFVRLAEHSSALKVNRRPLAQPPRPLGRSTAARKLDVGFVDGPDTTENSRCRLSQILIPGELKNDREYDGLSSAWLDLGRYAREVLGAQDSRRFVLGFTLCGPFLRLWAFDRLGGIASEGFDVNKEGLRFVSVILGFLQMDLEQLGFDPTIVTHGTKRCIEIEKDGTKERLVIEGVIGRARCIAGRATTCWKVHREEEPNTPLVVKDSWQDPERDEEGELLREATEREVTNVARYYHHETIHVGGKPDDILGIRRSLPVPTSNQEKAGSKAASNRSQSQPCQTLQPPSSTTGRKRSFNHSNTDFPPPPSKRTKSSSPTKLPASDKPLNRVHRRVVVRDYGKPIFESSSRVSLLIGMQGCIEGYMSLYHKAGLIQSDISPRNLLVNEDENNPSYRAFLTDLDLAIRAERDESSKARGRTGTRAFMAIGVL